MVDWFARLVHFNSLVEKIAAVDGDVVECGVADGASLAALASLLKIYGQTRQVWGFDSWAGLPAPSDADVGDASIAEGGMFSQSSTAKVRDELLAYGLTGKRSQNPSSSCRAFSPKRCRATVGALHCFMWMSISTSPTWIA